MTYIQEIRADLLSLVDEEYRKFHGGLLPGTENILGVRIPRLRELAKRIAKENWQEYLDAAPRESYEEIMLQGMVIGYAKMAEEERMRRLDAFVPQIDNWAVCDCCLSTYKFMAKNPALWHDYLLQQIEQDTEFSIRFGVVGLMDYFITETYIDELLSIFDGISHEGYYVKMGVAWAVSMCFVKFPRQTELFLADNHLDAFTQNKSIQKIRESYRVPRETKETLKKYKKPNTPQ